MNKENFYVCCWGIGDTLVDFYKVVKTTDKTIVLQQVVTERKVVKNEPGIVHTEITPTNEVITPSNEFDSRGKEFRKRFMNDGVTVYMDPGFCKPWDGEPKEERLGYY